MIKQVSGYLLGLIVGIFPGFFLVFNVIFTDGPGSERAFLFILILLSYLTLGSIFGFIFYRSGAWTALLIPSSLIVVLYSAGEGENLTLQVLALSIPIISVIIGSFFGIYWKKNWRSWKATT